MTLPDPSASASCLRSLSLGVCLLLAHTGTTAAQSPAPATSGTTVSFDLAEQAATELPRLRSLLVSHNGELVLERYYNGATPTRPANIKSASKSVVSALVGIAIERGLIPDVRHPIGGFFPDLLAVGEDEGRRDITIEDLLTMRSGLETTSNRNYGPWVTSSNWVRYVLAQPFEAQPGTRMIYSTGSTHLLSAILTRVSGSDTRRFAQEVLAGPLGFVLPAWTRDPQGIYFGGNEMAMTPRQMLAFGRLYLNDGRADNGERVLSPEWIRATFVARTPSPRERGRFYGYGWWIRSMAGYTTHYAWGYGGQFIFVVPGLDLVVVATSDSNPGEGRQQHLRRVYDLVEDYVVGEIAK